MIGKKVIVKHIASPYMTVVRDTPDGMNFICAWFDDSKEYREVVINKEALYEVSDTPEQCVLPG